MVIGDRLKAIREKKSLTQGDIEKRTGLLRCYLSRVENNHTVPSLDTLEKIARALEMPLYQVFFEGRGKPKEMKMAGEPRLSRRHAQLASELREIFGRIKDEDKKLLIGM